MLTKAIRSIKYRLKLIPLFFLGAVAVVWGFVFHKEAAKPDLQTSTPAQPDSVDESPPIFPSVDESPPIFPY